MSKNENKINLAEYNKPIEKIEAAPSKSIQGKEINICGLTQTRGKPSPKTKQADIGPDGKTDYFIIETVQTFQLPYKQEGVKPINHFFVTKTIASQINRVPDVQTLFANGTVMDTCKIIMRKNNKPGGSDYWCLAFPGDADY